MISQTELARRLGVSQTAVSAALRNQDRQLRLKPALATRIRQQARRLGYRPNLLARSLAQKKTQTLGVVVSDFSDPTFGSLLNHLQVQALKWKHELLVMGCGDREEEMNQIWERLLQRRVDAVLWIDCPSHTPLSKLERLWKKESVRVIGIGTVFRKSDVPALVFDSEDAVKQLSAEVKGAQPVVFLQSHLQEEFSKWRWECVQKEWGSRASSLLCDQNVPLDCLLSLHRQNQRLTLIGDQDLTSLRVMHALLNVGLKPKKDFFLGSFDGLSWLRGLKPTLSSIQQPLEEMSIRAIELAMETRPKHRVFYVKGKFLKGETL